MKAGTLFSGIGAPECAMPDLDWCWCAEIDPFAAAIHKARFPGVPNLGDVNEIEPDAVQPVDLVVFGSPCQSFSVAGRRLGLDDPRGNLALVALRLVSLVRPRWLVFENVPGLLSSDGGRDFGAFLGLLGECGYGWAYRVLDAQHFGVPQRRRRVFVVGHLGDWHAPAAVLFEPESLRGDSPPRRKAGQGIAPILEAGARTGKSTDDPRAGIGIGEAGAAPLTLAIRGRGDSHDLEYRDDGIANAILTPNGGRAGIGCGAVAFTQNSRSEVREIGGDGQILPIEAGSLQERLPPFVGAVAADYGRSTAKLFAAIHVGSAIDPKGSGAPPGISRQLDRDHLARQTCRRRPPISGIGQQHGGAGGAVDTAADRGPPMIATLLQQYGANLRKEWAHDRLATQGSSEAGRCARQSAFAKLEVAPDPGYVPTWGAALRGDLIENHFFVPGLRASLPPEVELLYAGNAQVTRVDGYLSATPDGLLAGVSRDCLVRHGIADIGGNELLIECKSIDPRMHMRREKPEHAYQVQVAMGVLRATTEHRPEYALLTYINASFLNDIQEFPIRFDPAIYRAAGDRARRILGASDPGELPPEGKMAGGSECKYCAWAEQCLGATVASIPPLFDRGGSELGDDAVHELKGLRDLERRLADEGEAQAVVHAAACEAIKTFLREHGVRQHRGDNWSVSWASVAGRQTVDVKAMEAAGIDVEAYRKEGKAGERLIVK